MYEKELREGLKIVKEKGLTFRKYFGTRTEVKIKNGNYRDLVSYADKKIEKDIKTALLKKFPDYGFLGEESEAVKSGGIFSWALDPIDGTTNYLYGLPDCCVSLALLRNGKPVVGILYAPMLGYVYTAKKGGKAALNNKVLKASKVSSLEKALGGVGYGKELNFGMQNIPKIMKKSLKIRIPGSAALGFSEVARGSFDFYVQSATLNIWDYAAAQVAVECAGGVFEKNDKYLIAASSKKLLKEIMQTL